MSSGVRSRGAQALNPTVYGSKGTINQILLFTGLRGPGINTYNFRVQGAQTLKHTVQFPGPRDPDMEFYSKNTMYVHLGPRGPESWSGDRSRGTQKTQSWALFGNKKSSKRQMYLWRIWYVYVKCNLSLFGRNPLLGKFSRHRPSLLPLKAFVLPGGGIL